MNSYQVCPPPRDTLVEKWWVAGHLVLGLANTVGSALMMIPTDNRVKGIFECHWKNTAFFVITTVHTWHQKANGKYWKETACDFTVRGQWETTAFDLTSTILGMSHRQIIIAIFPTHYNSSNISWTCTSVSNESLLAPLWRSTDDQSHVSNSPKLGLARDEPSHVSNTQRIDSP